jgi:4-amino-4-deoxy-L-arabinose transferase-like glycosyltransferase
MFLFDVAPIPGSSAVGIFLAVAFFLVFVGLAVFAFFMIRKTVKMAIRIAIVGLILLIAMVGSLALWFGIGSSPSRPNRPNRPPANAR